MIEIRHDPQAYKAIADCVGIDVSDVVRDLAGWDVRAVIVDHEAVGGIATKGCEIHCGVVPKASGRWFSKRVFKETIGQLLDEYGMAATTVRNENLVGHDFVQRLGFIPVVSDKKVTRYEIHP